MYVIFTVHTSNREREREGQERKRHRVFVEGMTYLGIEGSCHVECDERDNEVKAEHYDAHNPNGPASACVQAYIRILTSTHTHLQGALS